MAQVLPHRRAQPSGVHLTSADAAQAKGMLLRGDRQHDIASWFGVNGGRIAEIAAGLTFRDVEPAPAGELPPPGPYLSGRAASEALHALETAKSALAAAESRIRLG
jgi:hypothetical protein